MFVLNDIYTALCGCFPDVSLPSCNQITGLRDICIYQWILKWTFFTLCVHQCWQHVYSSDSCCMHIFPPLKSDLNDVGAAKLYKITIDVASLCLYFFLYHSVFISIKIKKKINETSMQLTTKREKTGEVEQMRHPCITLYLFFVLVDVQIDICKIDHRIILVDHHYNNHS